jgi:hypothetical protein
MTNPQQEPKLSQPVWHGFGLPEYAVTLALISMIIIAVMLYVAAGFPDVVGGWAL